MMRSNIIIRLIIGACLTVILAVTFAQDLPTFEELAVVRAKAHQDRFKTYVLKKLEVHSYAQEKRGMCLDFVGGNDGLYQSIFNSGPIMVDLANCGEEDDWVDGRIRALKILEAREAQAGLSSDQIDEVIAEINAVFADKIYDPEIKE